MTRPRGYSTRALFVLTICSVVLVATACNANLRGSGGSRTSESDEPSTPLAGRTIPLCEQLPRISAPADWYRDSPIYVSNEQPVEEIRAWAAGKPGFEEIWIDRDRLGWITVAFSVDAEARQAELEELFPDVGVVAVGVDWTMQELQDVQQRVSEELGPLFGPSSGILVQQGVVSVGVGVLKEDRLAVIEERFSGERICVEGVDPADAPAEGPPRHQGDGWRLLADQQGAGQPFRTGIASDQTTYQQLWTDIGLAGEPPAVDFESEVVVWFGAVYGSSCPSIRLDDVVVDHPRALVHAEIVLVDPPAACTGDANPHAYLVALQRARLPSGRFAIQLTANDPPGGFPEERTVVEADLSRPGAVAGPDQVHPDPATPKPFVLEYGSIIEPYIEYPYRLFVHCGIEWLGRFNDLAWQTDVPADTLDFVPPEWRALVDRDQMIEVSIVMHTDPKPVIEATANGHTVTYRPTAEDPPGCR